MAVEEKELSIADYVNVAKRRWPVILLGFIIGVLASFALALLLPSVYSAGGQIMIESPNISNDIIGRTNEDSAAKYVGERLDKVKRKILSRENLLYLNKQYQLHPGLEPTLVDKLLSQSIVIKPTKKSSDGSEWGLQVTVGFDVKYNNSEPEKAYKVAKKIIDQLMEENSRDRTGRATQTTSFLTTELNSLKQELERTENKVAAYKKKYANSLPEHQAMHMGMLEQFRTSLKDLERDYKNTKEELRYLDVELTTAHAALRKDDATTQAAISDLDKARAELARASALYKDTHPTLKALKRKVASLEESEQKKVLKPKKTNVAAELAVAKINSQLNAANARLGAIGTRKQSILAQMSKVQSQVVKIPEVERGLYILLRDYENAKSKYEDVKAKQVNAKIAEKLELDNKAERFVLTIAPEFPKYRISPKRKNIVGMGILGSIGFGFALALLLEFLDKRVRGLSTVSSIIKSKPIAVIPYIKTNGELKRERRLVRYGYLFIFLIVLILLALVVIHFFVMPLNIFITKFV